MHVAKARSTITFRFDVSGQRREERYTNIVYCVLNIVYRAQYRLRYFEHTPMILIGTVEFHTLSKWTLSSVSYSVTR